MKSDTSQLTLLGHKTVYKQDYAPEVLETFINKHPENDYWVRFNCPGRKQESKTLFIQFP